MIVIDIKEIYGETAKLSLMDEYTKKVVEIAGNGNEIVITGAGPVWMYLKLAHELHGKAKKLYYDSPVTGKVLVFDHDPN